MTRISAATLLLLGMLPVMAMAAAPDHSPWPGGIAVIDVGPAEAPRPIVEFDERRVLVTKNGDRWVAAVGIPLDTPAGETAKRSSSASAASARSSMQRSAPGATPTSAPWR